MSSTPPPHTATNQARQTSRPGFTLLELMIVFVIIAVLVGIALLVGQRVSTSSKVRSTQNVIQALDQAVDAYTAAKGGTTAKFPDRFVDGNKDEFPLADAVLNGTLVPSGELAVELLRNEPGSDAILKGIPGEFLIVDQAAAPAIGGAAPRKQGTGNSLVSITYTRYRDAWGNPIRFVHPAYQGIYTGTTRSVSLRQNGALTDFTIIRPWQMTGLPNPVNQGDGGLCTSGKPYFYSPGPDGNPATIEDNVYSVKPTFDAQVRAAGQ